MRYLEEIFLTEYFAYESFLNDRVKSRERIFDILATVFLLSKEDAIRLKRLVNLDEVKEILTDKDYYQYKRLEQFYALSNSTQKTRKDDLTKIIQIKGNALVNFFKCFPEKQPHTAQTLLKQATSGDVQAKRMVGLMMIEGIIFNKDETRALKLLKQAASWQSIEAMLTLLAFDKDSRKKTLSSLKVALYNLAEDNLFNMIRENYGIEDEIEGDENAEILQKLLNQGIVTATAFSPRWARTIFSSVISKNDKERILFSTNPNAIPETSNLPLKLQESDANYNLAVFDDMPFSREETSVIKNALNNSDLRKHSWYKVPCLVSKSSALLNLYCEYFKKAAKDSSITVIDVNEIEPQVLEPTSNNVFLNSCNEDKDNVYCIFIQGEVSEARLEVVKNFLINRHHFSIQNPSVSLNLSAILPIVFCDAEVATKLRKVCTVIRIQDVQKEEKADLVEYELEKASSLYGVEISMEPTLKEMLCSYSLDQAIYLLHEAVRVNRKRGEALILNDGNVKFPTPDNNTYGFRKKEVR